jgi:hypothetical protein
MKAWKQHPPRLLFFSFLHTSYALSQSVGIALQDLKYFEGSTFWCRDGSKRIPKERLKVYILLELTTVFAIVAMAARPIAFPLAMATSTP